MTKEDHISVGIEAEGWSSLIDDPEEFVLSTAQRTLRWVCPSALAGQISVLLTDDGQMRELNLAWRQIDKPTNVLSFPATDCRPGETPQPEFAGGPLILGDIALGLETVMTEAERAAIPVADHIRHLVVHGVLHLLGYDHMVDAEAEVMEAQERRILADLGVPDPYRSVESSPEVVP